MDLYNFINRINYFLKPELQNERITHVTDVCSIAIIDGKQSQVAYYFTVPISESLKKAFITCIHKEAIDYGYQIVVD